METFSEIEKFDFQQLLSFLPKFFFEGGVSNLPADEPTLLPAVGQVLPVQVDGCRRRRRRRRRRQSGVDGRLRTLEAVLAHDGPDHLHRRDHRAGAQLKNWRPDET